MLLIFSTIKNKSDNTSTLIMFDFGKVHYLQLTFFNQPIKATSEMD